MSNAVSYGNYDFNPAPFLELGNEPVFISGQIDYLRQNIGLVGQLTGCDLTFLKLQKEEMIAALSTGFQTLTVGNTGFRYAQPISITFEESPINKLLPYRVDFSSHQEQDFSQAFGILDPVDTWTFQEQDNRIVAATHEVSAKAVKTTADSLLACRNFVDGRLKGFDPTNSMFFTGDTAILVDKKETLNRINNTYGVTEEWQWSQEVDGHDVYGYIGGAIVRPSAQIDWADNSLSISINGTIEGGISGSADTGYFTPDDAKVYAQNATRQFRSVMEQDYYDEVVRAPSSYQYESITGANSISFSFSFSDPDIVQTGNVRHEYRLTFAASKDDPNVTANIQGRVFYDSFKDVFTSLAPEAESRYKQVEAFFSGVDPYAITQQHFDYFNDANLPYADRPLETRYETFQINKLPFNSEIQYNFTYNNKIDLFSGKLVDASATISCEHSIAKWKISPNITDGFCAQELYQTRERKTLSVNGTVPTGVSIYEAIEQVSGWMNQYSNQAGTLTSDICQTGNGQLQMTKSFVI